MHTVFTSLLGKLRWEPRRFGAQSEACSVIDEEDQSSSYSSSADIGFAQTGASIDAREQDGLIRAERNDATSLDNAKTDDDGSDDEEAEAGTFCASCLKKLARLFSKF